MVGTLSIIVCNFCRGKKEVFNAFKFVMLIAMIEMNFH